jgi:hypothetical protein
LTGIALTTILSSPMTAQAATEGEVHPTDETGLLDARSGEFKEVVLPSVLKYALDITTLKNVKFNDMKNHASPSTEFDNLCKDYNITNLTLQENYYKKIDCRNWMNSNRRMQINGRKNCN